MFGNVWDWAGKFRKVELSIGIKAYLVPTTLKELADDIAYWDKHKTFGFYELFLVSDSILKIQDIKYDDDSIFQLDSSEYIVKCSIK